MRAGGRARIGVAVAAWGAMLACVPHPSPDPVCEGGTVTATRNAVFVTPTGEVSRVFKPTTVQALLPLPGAGRGYVVCPGTDDGNGHLTIPNVPDGPYYFQRGTVYVQTSARDLDFTSFVLGRPDGVSAKSATQVSLQAANLESWSSKTDSVELFSWGARVYQFAVDRIATGAPSDGSTQLALGIDWSKLDTQNLLAGADQLLVTQYASRPVGSGTGSFAVKQLTLSGTTLRDGQSATLSGTFSDLPLSRSFSTNWQRSAFDALTADVAPDAIGSTQDMFVIGMPGGAQHGFYDVALDLFHTGFSVAGGTDVQLSTNLAAPPSGFTALIEVEETVSVARGFKGGSGSIDANIYVEDTLDHADRGSVAPQNGAIKAPKIAGNDAFQPQTGTGLTPLVSWTRPTPAPQVVRLFVEKVTGISSGALDVQVVATLQTNDDSLQIPEGVLMTGETYLIDFEAISSAGASLDHAPFRFGEPTTIIETLTETFTP